MNNKEIEISSNELPKTLIILWSMLCLSTAIYMLATNNVFAVSFLFIAITTIMLPEIVEKPRTITRYATVSVGLLLIVFTLAYDKQINKYGNDFRDRIIQDINAATVSAVSLKTEARLANSRLLEKDPVAFVESTMAKLAIELNEYERVNLKALQTAAIYNSEITDERIKSYKEYIADVKTSNYKSNFIRLTLLANTFSLEACSKYNSKAFCDDLASQTIPEIKMNHAIRSESFIHTGLMNYEQKEKYLAKVHAKIDKALDKRPYRVLTDREVNNIFESVPTETK